MNGEGRGFQYAFGMHGLLRPLESLDDCCKESR
ncbi:hypothetical protein M2341_001501 [Sphingobium sp. B7D2B]|nr:hypothetical protein [Sphingobium sp. B10D3B]MCW2366054.1 hypothetical protein [Sphingobium sp. B7D2B]MCW2401169.1 hypothetical protein [Sphingobium sp. B10D7B]MCW2408149.1 hypothetical protein [Sphingobium xanthum]